MNFSSPAFSLSSLPTQMKSYSEKIANGKKWAKETVDVFEQIARNHRMRNMSISENYRMLNGEFILSHYYEVEGVQASIDALAKDLDIPSTLKHYDIINKVVNNLTEKLSDFPDVFRVEEFYEEDDTNEYIRTQTDLLHKSVQANINAEIMQRMAAEGVDLNKVSFDSEEEAQQYQEMLQQMKDAMTPKQIDRYMKTGWNSQGEIWGNHQLTVDKRRFNLPQLEKVEFRDMLASDMCFRHFYLTPTGYSQETWNPLTVFFHVSPDVYWSQEGNYIGQQRYYSKADVIDRLGWKMTKKQLEKLEPPDDEKDNGTDLTGFPYNVYAPFPDYKAYDLTRRTFGFDPMNHNVASVTPPGADTAIAFGDNSYYGNEQIGLFCVTEVYWKSQRKIGKVVYIDKTTGVLTKMLVDENFIPPPSFTQKNEGFYKAEDVNTVYWTWINETWKGTKITSTYDTENAIYLDLEPLEFQFKSEDNPYGCYLPVCGRVFNNRNAQSMALVDLMKSHQINHNICMNQLSDLLSSEEAMFAVWDSAFFETMKDWAGEDAAEKIQYVAKNLHHVVGNSTRSNATANQYPKTVDLDFTSRMMSRAKLAEFFENRAIGQLGIAPQFMAKTDPNETAQGNEIATQGSMTNIQKYFSDFFEYKRRCLSMNLDIAQFVQATKRDSTIMYTKSDMSREFIRQLNLNLLLRDLHTYVVDSKELLKQIELAKQLFLNNNTTDASAADLFTVISENSPSAIKAQLLASDARKEQKEQNILAQQKQMHDEELQAEDKKEDREDRRVADTNQTKKEVAYITTFNKNPGAIPDNNQDQVPDALEQSKFAQESMNRGVDQQIKRESNRIAEKTAASNTRLKEKELDLKKKSLRVKQEESKNSLKIARENKNKYSK